MWGIADFVGGLASKRTPSAVIAGISQFVGLLIMCGIGLTIGFDWDNRALGWAFLSGLSGFAGISLFYKALATGRMGIVSPIAALGALVPLSAGLLAGDSPSSIQLVGVIFAIVGVVLASGPELSGGADPKPVLFAVGAACGFGVALWSIARGSEYSVVTTMTMMRCFSVAIAALGLLVTRTRFAVATISWPMVVVAGAFDVLANVAFGYATTGDLLSLVSVLGSLYPVATVLLAWAILKERLQAVQYVGVFAALLGVAAIAGG
jgi:drug/metabolite transporter (DMT)-like permease